MIFFPITPSHCNSSHIGYPYMKATGIFKWTAVDHDDVIKWKHFPHYWLFVQGIHLSLVNSPHKGQWRGALMFSLVCALNKRLSKQSRSWWLEMPSRSLWCHCNVDSHPLSPLMMYVSVTTGLALVHVMVSCLFGAKQLPEPMLTYYKLAPEEQTSIKLESKYENYPGRKCFCKCHYKMFSILFRGNGSRKGIRVVVPVMATITSRPIGMNNGF